MANAGVASPTGSRSSSSRLLERADSAPFAVVDGREISQAAFVSHVLRIAALLPDGRYVVNQCNDRYAFTVVFFAALLRQQTNLLPAQRSPDTLAWLRNAYPDCYEVADSGPICAELDALVADRDPNFVTDEVPWIENEQVAAIAFTSGSTGSPQPHAKSWGLLRAAARVHARYLPGDGTQPRGMVATSPSSHMYGLEWAMMVPTVVPVTIYCGAAFYPNDIIAALRRFRCGTILVSGPVHLRALLRSGQRLPQVEVTISATAPMESQLAEELERRLVTQVFEIYGCSEVGSLACRYPARQSSWRFFDCFDATFDADRVTVAASFLDLPVSLPDAVKALPDGSFELLGRASDLVKVAGKRASLTQLTAQLLSIDGVDDGVFVCPKAMGWSESERLAAVVVAPALSADAIRAALAKKLDPAFLPRPLRLVKSLPRAATGKLTAASLQALLRSGSD